MPVPSYTTSDSSFFHIFPPYILYSTLNQHLSQSWLCREFSVGIIPWCGHVLSPIIRSRCVSIQWIGFPMNWYLFHFISLNISWACHLLGKFSNRYWYTDIYTYTHIYIHMWMILFIISQYQWLPTIPCPGARCLSPPNSSQEFWAVFGNRRLKALTPGRKHGGSFDKNMGIWFGI